jgi:sporulation integral membrane protein YtvI
LLERHQQLVKLKPLFLFFIIFTAAFFLFAITLKYTFPFLAGFLLAMAAQPIIRWMTKKLHWPSALSSAIATLLVYMVFFGLLFLLGYWLIYEISNLISYISKLSQANLAVIIEPINSWINQAGANLKKIDAGFVKDNQEKILSLVQGGIGVLGKVLSAALNFLTSLPAILTMFIVMILSTYFFSKDMTEIKRVFRSLFSDKTANNLRSYSRSGKSLGGRYVCSYLLIYFITFLETLAVFTALGVPYPLVLSILTGIADILPVLGPGTIYVPLALIYLVQANYFHAGALLICWLLISAIRQIIEPKIVSSSISIHPLTMLAALYFALVAKNFWIFLYFSVLILSYKVLTQAGTLPHLWGSGKHSKGEEGPNDMS